MKIITFQQRHFISMRHLLLLTVLFACTFPSVLLSQPIYKNSEASIDERVEDLLERMTLYEKIGQMTQLNITMINPTYDQNDVILVEEQARDLIKNHHIGSFLNGGAVPPRQWFTYIDGLTRLAVEESRLDIPIIYGMDHVHGANYLGESTIFPQGINLAATFNLNHAFEMGWVTALETADIGHHWNFAPILDLGVNPQWPRFWETFGEDPYLASRLGEAYVKGLQGNSETAPYKIAGTAKHFLAYSNPVTGWDRTPVQIGMQAIHEIHRPPFQAAIDAGIKTVMLNSGEVNGVPVHASKKLVTGLLRNEMGFDGVVLTDWEDIGKLYNFHKVARDYKEATLMAIEAGIDMSMTPTSLEFNEALLELAEEGRITEERIDESVRRILRLKFELGLFENPYPRDDRLHRIGSEESTRKNLQAAEESIVLLRNQNNVLPIENPRSILVLGPAANSKRNLSGGWTLEWQGAPEEKYPDDINTLYTALQEKYPQADIQLIADSELVHTGPESDALTERFNRADLLIYAGGEDPYTEFIGNITDVRLPDDQLDAISLLSRSDTPLAFIYIGGRPRLVSDVILKTDAFIFAGLPGFEGANAIANIVSGEANPSGKLPFSYPQYPNHHTPYNHKPSDTYFFDPSIPNNISQGQQNTSLFPFGSGLSYTTFEYSGLVLSDTTITRGKSIDASVTVTNTGSRPGMESVLWFITDEVGKITRPVKELKHFDKAEIQPGESKTFHFAIDPVETLSYPDENGNRVLEWGEFTVQAGPLQQSFTLEQEEREYSMIWSDEFNGTSLDSSVWNFWEGTAYNNELQYYTSRPENIFLKDGKLHIRAQKEDYRGMNYTSARISTDSTSVGWKHGRFEAKIKMPAGKGFWPAFWLMPVRDIGWPRGGEIDIMEFRGNEPNTTTGAVHFYKADCEGSSTECRQYYTDSITLPNTDLTDDYHLYALEWTEEELIWFLDDQEFFRIHFDDIDAAFNPFSTPFYIILNLAVGGDFLENPDETTPFPQSLIVDYVRVYKEI